MIRLLICDESRDARGRLRTTLAGHPEIAIVGEAANAGEALALALKLVPDVVLLDVATFGLDGVAATERLRERFPEIRIVALAGPSEHEAAQAMVEAGASDYVVEDAPLWELERAIAGAAEPLVRLAHLLTRSLPSVGIGQLVARELVELAGAALAAVYGASPDVGLSLAGVAGAAAPDSVAAAPEVAVRAFRAGQPAEANARELAELFRLGIPSGSALAVPLLEQGEPLGVVLVAMPANVQFEIDPALVAAAADLAAAAMANQRKLALTYAEARRDALTGLQNRRAFDEALEKRLREARETGREATLALLDLDDFKRINDEGGHAAGDEVLREMARVLGRRLRADDPLFRVGGDEFALVLSGSKQEGAAVVERLSEAVAEHRRGCLLPTFSAGIAGFPTDAGSEHELLERADAALYAAKRDGKNRVAVYGGVLERGAERSAAAPVERPLRVLLVDDDAGLRTLLRTTFEIIDIEVEEGESVAAAELEIAARPPDVLVLDVAIPGEDGLSFCRRLKESEATRAIPVLLLTGAAEATEERARQAGADALLSKPFSPLELLEVIERLAGGLYEGPFRLMTDARPEEQLLLYAQDLRRMLEIERAQRMLLERTCEETVSALASALESKDFGTHAHSQRVERYAVALTSRRAPRLLADPSLKYGFLLHDIGKIAIPDRILRKPGPLSARERKVMQTHAPRGEEMLAGIALLQGEGLKVIRSHHERWDGRGYPDGLAGEEIPLGGRIFAVADALDAMTSPRPYRAPLPWEAAFAEIVAEAGLQFDPTVVEAFRESEQRLRRIHQELAAVA